MDCVLNTSLYTLFIFVWQHSSFHLTTWTQVTQVRPSKNYLLLEFTLKGCWWWWGVTLTSLVVFPKVYLLEMGWSTAFFTFNIFNSHVFPENLIKILQVVLKIWSFLSSTLTFFIDLSDFLAILFCKETNDVSIIQMM